MTNTGKVMLAISAACMAGSVAAQAIDKSENQPFVLIFFAGGGILEMQEFTTQARCEAALKTIGLAAFQADIRVALAQCVPK